MTVKTVTLCMKLFFHEKSKKQEKETDTNFVLLCQSGNMIREKSIKAFLNKPIKIL